MGDSTDDFFGQSITLNTDGTILAIGATGSDESGINSGRVTVYGWNEASLQYKQRGKSIDGERSGDSMGLCVSLSGDGMALAVAPITGQAKVYGWDEAASNYVRVGLDTSTGLGDSVWSLSLSGDGKMLAIGYNKGSDPGQVKIYAWNNAASNYIQLGKTLAGDAGGDQFGKSVSLTNSGRVLAVGAPNHGPGYVHIFTIEC